MIGSFLDSDKDKLSRDILSDITVHMKYARYLPKKERRETWKELVTRNKKMHLKKYPELKRCHPLPLNLLQ